eukprot:1319262-Rhodomonas_salina.1
MLQSLSSGVDRHGRKEFKRIVSGREAGRGEGGEEITCRSSPSRQSPRTWREATSLRAERGTRNSFLL